MRPLIMAGLVILLLATLTGPALAAMPEAGHSAPIHQTEAGFVLHSDLSWLPWGGIQPNGGCDPGSGGDCPL